MESSVGRKSACFENSGVLGFEHLKYIGLGSVSVLVYVLKVIDVRAGV